MVRRNVVFFATTELDKSTAAEWGSSDVARQKDSAGSLDPWSVDIIDPTDPVPQDMPLQQPGKAALPLQQPASRGEVAGKVAAKGKQTKRGSKKAQGKGKGGFRGDEDVQVASGEGGAQGADSVQPMSASKWSERCNEDAVADMMEEEGQGARKRGKRIAEELVNMGDGRAANDEPYNADGVAAAMTKSQKRAKRADDMLDDMFATLPGELPALCRHPFIKP